MRTVFTLALDVYTWLAHRLCRIGEPGGVAVSWSSLHAQFGHEYKVEKDFRRELLKALWRVVEAYPEPRVERIRGGLRLKPSPPPVARRSHLVVLPSVKAPEPAPRPKFISSEALEKVPQIAPGWDKYALEPQYLDWSARQDEAPRDIDRAFLGWVKAFTKGKKP